VCAALRTLIEAHNDHVLVLGVTPELSTLACRTLAIDWSPTSLAHIWPGNEATRTAIRANWLELPVARASISGAIGDGSLNCLEYPHEYRRVFTELTRVLRPGARVVVRIFLTPNVVESVEAVCADAAAGLPGSIHGLKWRIANALAGLQDNPNVAVRSIHGAFNSRLPDRHALQRATGWTRDEIEQIDAYADLPDVVSFPTAAQVGSVAREFFENVRLVPTGVYELAERCPILVIDVPR
jgi:SAM-dependent methyltransferase